MKTLILLAVTAVVFTVVGARGDEVATTLGGEEPRHAWYACRAAGVASYLFLWIGFAGGLWMSSGWFDGIVHRGRLLALHQTGSVAGVVLGLGHALVLIPDPDTNLTFREIVVPSSVYYTGQATFYLSAVVAFSFWFRSRIGAKPWKRLHYVSVAAYGVSLAHGLMKGSDAGETWMLSLYLSTFLVVVFVATVRIAYKRRAPRRRAATSQA